MPQRAPVKEVEMMSLFGANRAAQGTIEEVGHMIVRYFKNRGLDPKAQEISGSQGCGWWLIEGSARVYIFVQDAAGGPVIRITSPIVTLPEKGDVTAFYRHLLDVNSNLTSCALATSDNAVLVVAQRATAQLDQEELDSMIWNVAYVADLLDDKLVK
jgi:hypothetical protein